MSKSKSTNRQNMERVASVITVKVNSKNVKRETRNGREVIVVPSTTLPDNVIMNGIMYPADEIERGYKSLEGTLAPYGHPTGQNGEFIDASSPLGLSLGYIGAHNENLRRENGIVHLDKVIDVEVANSTKRGRDVIAAVDKGEPIHTSTALYHFLEESNNSDHSFVSRDMQFDHDAILLDEEGAATPEQGVGMMVNSKGEKIRVFNSYVDMLDDELDWTISSVVGTLEHRERHGMVQRLKQVLIEAFHAERQTENPSTEESEMDEKTREEFQALNSKVDGLSESIAKAVGDAVTGAIKPMTDHFEEQRKAAEAQNAARKETLVVKLTSANRLTREVADMMSIEMLEAMDKSVPDGRSAQGVNGRMDNNTNSGDTDYALPKGD